MRGGVSLMAQYFTRATDQVNLGAEMDQAGVPDIFVTESVNEVSSSLTALALRTQRATIGSAIAIMFLRQPHTLAVAATSANDLSGGRLVLGIGTGHHSMMQKFGLDTANQYSRMVEYVACVRAAMNGAVTMNDVGGDYYQIRGTRGNWTPPARIPIVLAALGDKMVTLGCTEGDGIITSLATMDQMRHFRQVATETAVAAGKRPEDVTIYAVLHACIRDSREEARDLARPGMGYSGMPFYQQEFARSGINAPGGIMDDAAVDALAIAGPIDYARDRLAAWRDAGVDVPLLAPVSTEPDIVAAYRSFLPLLV